MLSGSLDITRKQEILNEDLLHKEMGGVLKKSQIIHVGT